jgi:hypothetical protein
MKRAQQVFKVLAVLLVSGCLAFALPPSARAQDNQNSQDGQGDYSNVRIVRLSFVEGDVQYQRGDEDWQAAPMNLPIQEGFKVATGNGRAEIEFESGLIVRLADNSELDFTQLALLNGGRITQLTVVQGTIIATANPRTNDALSIIAPNLQVGVTRAARFRVDTAQGDSWVTVIKGDVAVTSAAGDSRVTSGRTLHISATNPEQVSMDKSADQDDFDHWAADRDRILEQGYAQAVQNIGADASDYSDYSYGLADLSGYGSFINVAGYGRCWQPFGISVGWMPFWNGRMIYFPGFGWTWVSFEPWGWLPFHTGNWFFLAGRGWCWRPGPIRVWNPAPVHWVRVGTGFGWTPRGAWNPNEGHTGPWIVKGGSDRPGEIRPGERWHGRPEEVAKGNPPAPPTFGPRGRQPGRGAPTTPVDAPVRGPIARNPLPVMRDDNPPKRPVRSAPVSGPPQFVGGPVSQPVRIGGSTDVPPIQPTGAGTPAQPAQGSQPVQPREMSPRFRMTNPVAEERPKETQQPPAPVATPTPVQTPVPQPAPPPRYAPTNPVAPVNDDRSRPTPSTPQPVQQQPRYTPPAQPQQPQQAAPPRYTPPAQPQQQQHSSPPPSAPPAQHSSPPPSAPAQHSSPPPAQSHGGDSGGGGSKGSSSSSSSSSSTPVHHR